MKYLRPGVSMATAGLFLLAFACSGATSPVALTGETIFSIPWGEGWGQLTFVPEAQLSEGMYYGPSAMTVGPDGHIYVYDPARRRLHSFMPSGRFDTGAEFGPGIGNVVTIVFGVSGPGVRPPIFVADDAGYIAKLNAFRVEAGSTGYARVLEHGLNTGASLCRLGMVTPGKAFLAVSGVSETPYIQCFEADRYLRRFNATDLVALAPRYYGLALDRHGKDLYVNAEGQYVVQEIDGFEAQVSREVPLTLPQIPEKRSRWHLFGAGAQGVDAVFFFAPHWPLRANDPIYAVSEKGNIMGAAKAALPDGEEPGRYLRNWNHHAVVDFFGNLYLAVPTDNGLAIVRYQLPAAG